MTTTGGGAGGGAGLDAQPARTATVAETATPAKNLLDRRRFT
jgi:hypothetical protein